MTLIFGYHLDKPSGMPDGVWDDYIDPVCGKNRLRRSMVVGELNASLPKDILPVDFYDSVQFLVRAPDSQAADHLMTEFERRVNSVLRAYTPASQERNLCKFAPRRSFAWTV